MFESKSIEIGFKIPVLVVGPGTPISLLGSIETNLETSMLVLRSLIPSPRSIMVGLRSTTPELETLHLGLGPSRSGP